MDSMIARLRVSLQLDSAAFESQAEVAASKVNALGVNMGAARAKMASFSEGLIVGSNAAQRMGGQMRATNDNAGLMRSGLQNAGFQLQDIAVQFASGAKAGTIFAQQLPQLSGAISQIAAASGKTTGVIGGLASFLSGPWGIAVGVGAAVLPPLIAKLFDTGDAARDGAKGIYTLGDALSKLKTAPMEALGKSQEKVLLAQGKLNNARNTPIPQGSSEAARASQLIAQQNRDRAVSDAQFELESAQRELGILKMVQSKQDALAKTAQPLVATIGNSRTRTGSAGRVAAPSNEITGWAKDIDDLSKKYEKARNEAEAFSADMEKIFGGEKLGKLDPQRAFKMRVAAATGNAERTTIYDQPDDLAKRVQDRLGDINDTLSGTKDKTKTANREIGESFQQMADNALNSLRELTSGIQSGDFLGILGGLVHVLESLGGIGLFGKGVQANVKAFNKVPGFANGTNFAPGGLALVGERGPELVNLPRGSRVYPNGTGPGGGASPYFDLRGAVVTQDLIDRMNAVGAVAAQAGGELG